MQQTLNSDGAAVIETTIGEDDDFADAWAAWIADADNNVDVNNIKGSISWIKDDGSTLSYDLDSGGANKVQVVDSKLVFEIASNDIAAGDYPQTNAIMVFTGEAVKPRLFRVIGVSEPQTNEYEVSAILYDPEKYDRIEQNLYIPQPQAAAQPLIETRPKLPNGINARLTEYAFGNENRLSIDVSVIPNNEPRIRSYEMEVLCPGATDYELVANQSDLFFRIGGVLAGEYLIRVRSISEFGQASDWLQQTVDSRNLTLLLEPPENFYIEQQESDLFLSWDAVPSISRVQYEVRLSFAETVNGVSWAASYLVGRTDRTQLIVPKLSGFFIIRSFDEFGKSSGTFSLTENKVNYLPSWTLEESKEYVPSAGESRFISSIGDLTSPDFFTAYPPPYFFVDARTPQTYKTDFRPLNLSGGTVMPFITSTPIAEARATENFLLPHFTNSTCLLYTSPSPRDS